MIVIKKAHFEYRLLSYLFVCEHTSLVCRTGDPVTGTSQRRAEIALEVEGELLETVYLGGGYGSVRHSIACSITVGELS
jgi:hypothetical protein